MKRFCAWDRREIPAEARSDSIYCSKSCRQAAHRFRKGERPRPAAETPIKLAYADPPYPGLSARYYADHPDYDGEVDHARLIESLSSTYDGWALSTAAKSLPEILKLCPEGVRVAAWVRGFRPTSSHFPLNAWEPVVFYGGRQEADASPVTGAPRRLDTLVYGSRPRRTDPDRVIGMKPAEFCWWLFDLLGARKGDELYDLFPGSGGVARAWTILNEGAPRPPWEPLPLFDRSVLEEATA